MEIKFEHMPMIVSLVALLVGGGNQYQTWGSGDAQSSNKVMSTHTAAGVGDLYIEIGKLENRIEQLEENK